MTTDAKTEEEIHTESTITNIEACKRHRFEEHNFLCCLPTSVSANHAQLVLAGTLVGTMKPKRCGKHAPVKLEPADATDWAARGPRCFP